MKAVFLFLISFLLLSTSFASNEEKNLSILMLNGATKIHSSDKALNGKLLADELADSLQAKNAKKVTVENVCESPRMLLSNDSREKMRFEDCNLVIKKKKGTTVSIQYQIKTKIKNGKMKSLLRKKTLKASYL